VTQQTTVSPRGNRFRNPIVLAALVVIAAGLIVTAVLIWRAGINDHPRVLNEPTPARQVIPLSTNPDPRFAPLPIEREKHDL
jgi:hypothetical protein